MYQHIISNKRASLSPAQRSRNGFCSTIARALGRSGHSTRSVARPGTAERCDFHAYAGGIRVDVRLGCANSHIFHPAECSDPIESRMGERFLEVVSTLRRNLLDL